MKYYQNNIMNTLNVQTFADEFIREFFILSGHKLSRMRSSRLFRIHKVSRRANFEIFRVYKLSRFYYLFLKEENTMKEIKKYNKTLVKR